MRKRTPKMSVSASVRYGSYKHLFCIAEAYASITESKFDKICNYINLPTKLNIMFRPIRNADGRAFYQIQKGTRTGKLFIVEIDVRQNLKDFYDTLLHELVHIEQFYEGRLVSEIGFNDFFKWNKERISLNVASREEYDQLPWEREAIARSKELKKIIFK